MLGISTVVAFEVCNVDPDGLEQGPSRWLGFGFLDKYEIFVPFHGFVDHVTAHGVRFELEQVRIEFKESILRVELLWHWPWRPGWRWSSLKCQTNSP